MFRTLICSRNLLCLLASAVLVFAPVCAAQAQILLNIDVSPTGTVTIIATDNASVADVAAGNDFFDGVDLLNFFTNDVGFGPVGGTIQSTLTTGTGSLTFDSAYGDTYGFGDAARDLNLYASNGSGVPETFSTGTAAFTGTFTIDLSGDLGALPTANASGSIISGANGVGTDTPIGTWQVVIAPEPSVWMLFLAGLLLLVLYRRVARLRFLAANPIFKRPTRK
jgi:hypothetical protein